MSDRTDRQSATHRDAGQPLGLTLNPRLDAAVAQGWEAFESAARAAGADQVASWLAQRLGQPRLKADLIEPIAALLDADDPDDRAVARAELAELVEGEDDLTADTLWEGVLARARETDDPDLMVEAIAHLAEIAEAQGDPLAAAEFHLEFLNWRRQPGRISDPDAVLDAFDEVIRLAHLDGDPTAAALYEYRQAAFSRLANAEDDRATEGDWEREPVPYESWS
jgi:hypothetical protein